MDHVFPFLLGFVLGFATYWIFLRRDSEPFKVYLVVRGKIEHHDDEGEEWKKS